MIKFILFELHFLKIRRFVIPVALVGTNSPELELKLGIFIFSSSIVDPGGQSFFSAMFGQRQVDLPITVEITNIQAVEQIRSGNVPEFYQYAGPDWRDYNAQPVAKYRMDELEPLLNFVRATQQTLLKIIIDLQPEELYIDRGIRIRSYRITIARLLEAELKDERVEASVGGGAVKVVMTGELTVESVTIDPGAVDTDDIGMLEDMVAAAVNEAVRQAQDRAARKMQAVTGGLGLPGGLF